MLFARLATLMVVIVIFGFSVAFMLLSSYNAPVQPETIPLSMISPTEGAGGAWQISQSLTEGNNLTGSVVVNQLPANEAGSGGAPTVFLLDESQYDVWIHGPPEEPQTFYYSSYTVNSLGYNFSSKLQAFVFPLNSEIDAPGVFYVYVYYGAYAPTIQFHLSETGPAPPQSITESLTHVGKGWWDASSAISGVALGAVVQRAIEDFRREDKILTDNQT